MSEILPSEGGMSSEEAFWPSTKGRTTAALAVGLLGCCLLAWSLPSREPAAFIRLNQAGYLTSEGKQAVLMADRAETGARFRVLDAATGRTVFSEPVGPAGRGWNRRFKYTYRLTFDPVHVPGRYLVQVKGPADAPSPLFRVQAGPALYEPLLAHALLFYHAQRDGQTRQPGLREPTHLADWRAWIYDRPTYRRGALQLPLRQVGGPVDVSGGWYDAGDYVKFVETASYTDTVLLLAARRHPDQLSSGATDFRREGRYGLDWLLKMWDPKRRVLYYQVGIGDGAGERVKGDHDFWRLPRSDDRMKVGPGDPAYYVKYRPVLQAGPPGSPISPNLAGRMAAALALGAQLYASTNPVFAHRCLRNAETIYGLARTDHVGELLTTSPHDFYPETDWRDDMELGAAELYFATALTPAPFRQREPRFYLQQAAHWASSYIHGPAAGHDSLNMYDVSALAHGELCRALRWASRRPQDGTAAVPLEVTRGDLIQDLRRQLEISVRQADTDPFGLGIPYGGADATPHALGLAVTARLYHRLTGDGAYDAFARRERDWVLGDNAWGVSFVVGAGDNFPTCLHHQVANLAGALDGTGPLLLGATVDGPASEKDLKNLDTDDHMVLPSRFRGDPYALFSGRGARFMDNVMAWPCVEPADDYTALTVLLFAQETYEDIDPATVATGQMIAEIPSSRGLGGSSPYPVPGA